MAAATCRPLGGGARCRATRAERAADSPAPVDRGSGSRRGCELPRTGRARAEPHAAAVPRPPTGRVRAHLAADRAHRRAHAAAGHSASAGANLEPVASYDAAARRWEAYFWADGDIRARSRSTTAAARCSVPGPGSRPSGRSPARRGKFGHRLNAPYMWLPLCALFLAAVHRPAAAVPDPALGPAGVLLSFGASHTSSTAARSWPRCPLVSRCSPTSWCACSWRGSAREPQAGRSCRSCRWLRAGRGAGLPRRLPGHAERRRLGRDRRRVRRGDRGGADHARRLALRRPLPGAERRGDTYGPSPIWPTSPSPWAGLVGKWDKLPAAHAAAIAFDLLTIVALLLLGRAVRAGPEGRLLGLAWRSPGRRTLIRPTCCRPTRTTRSSPHCSSGPRGVTHAGRVALVAGAAKPRSQRSVPLFATARARPSRAARRSASPPSPPWSCSWWSCRSSPRSGRPGV